MAIAIVGLVCHVRYRRAQAAKRQLEEIRRLAAAQMVARMQAQAQNNIRSSAPETRSSSSPIGW